jgi:hypothetical protein
LYKMAENNLFISSFIHSMARGVPMRPLELGLAVLLFFSPYVIASSSEDTTRSESNYSDQSSKEPFRFEPVASYHPIPPPRLELLYSNPPRLWPVDNLRRGLLRARPTDDVGYNLPLAKRCKLGDCDYIPRRRDSSHEDDYNKNASSCF